MIPQSRSYEDDLYVWLQNASAKAKMACGVCRGQGVVCDFSSGTVRSEKCACVERVNLEFRLTKGNVPRSFWGRPSFLEPGDQAEKFAADDGPLGVFFTGDYGTGKTSRACWMLSLAAAVGRSIFRIEASEVERALSLVKSRQDWVDRWLQQGFFADVVSLDELGVEAVRGVCGREARATISYVLKHRVENGMRTYACTNLDRDQMLEHYGEASVSVLFGTRFTVAPLDREDMRR